MKKIKNLLIAIAGLSLSLGAAIGIGLTNKDVKEAKADNGDVTITKITLKDDIGWWFRTLWLGDVSLYSGYTNDDLNAFLDDYFGDSVDDWNRQSDTRSFHRYGNGMNLCAGGSSGTYVFELPWWIQDFSITAQNSGREVYCGTLSDLRKWSNNTTDKHGNKHKKDITIKVENWDGNPGGTILAGDEDVSKQFGTCTISKSAVSYNGTQLEDLGSVSWDKYTRFERPADGVYRSGYLFDKWYKNAGLSEEFNGGLVISNLSLKAKYDSISASFINSSDVVGDALTFNPANGNFEGVIDAGSTFAVRVTLNGVVTDYHTLEYAMKDYTAIATVSGNYVVVHHTKACSVYFHTRAYNSGSQTNEMWVEESTDNLQAYMFSGYFLSNIGCDPNGINTPSGWSTVSSKYATISDGAKDIIYSFNIATAGESDTIKLMIECYNWALSHNPNSASMAHFIKDHSGNERAIPNARVANPVAPATATSSDNITMITIVAISFVSLVAVGGYFFIRKRKEY